MAEKLVLDDDRFFDPDPTVRTIARELYASVKDLPLVSPHGHVDPGLFAENKTFPDPAALIIIPDHYIFRMLYSQGIPLESLGIPTIDGTPVETDHRKIWQIFGEHFHLFAGTPTGVWLAHELSIVFGVKVKLTGGTAPEIYDHIQRQLQTPAFRPRALFDRFNIALLTTTDAAEATLEAHRAIRASGWRGNIIPCFRPDGVVNLAHPDWRENIAALGKVSRTNIGSYRAYIQALEERRTFFKSMGAVSTDHDVSTPYTHRLPVKEVETIFQRGLKGRASPADAEAFTAHMLMELARMSVEDGLVMQIHPGSFRSHNQAIYERFGANRGGDIPTATEYTRNLHELLNAYGNDPRFRLVLFTLDESTFSRELAPLAGHYPALRLGSPWWFHDSIEGMTRFRERVTETAGIYNTAGFTDDTQAFPSVPARHDLARRIDANFLAGKVARHVIDPSDAREMIKALSYDLAIQTYRLAASE